MYGAILGDIIGSPFEFDRGAKTKEFPLFAKDSRFTDDTVMTIAVAEALINVRSRGIRITEEEELNKAGHAAADTVKRMIVSSMKFWGLKYPGVGYGGKFKEWLSAIDPRPYGSFDNGSAMRVSPAGWLYDSLKETRVMARATAMVSHDHPEGLKAAEAIASCIYMARKGTSKDAIRSYVEDEFGYDLSMTLEEIRPSYRFTSSAAGSVPQAIRCFLESTDLEDAIRNAVSIGGDTDTVACVAGSVAEAFYGIPEDMIRMARSYMDEEMLEICDMFDRAITRKILQEKRKDEAEKEPLLVEPKEKEIPEGIDRLMFPKPEFVKKAVEEYFNHKDQKHLVNLMFVLSQNMDAKALVPTPFIDVNGALNNLDLKDKVKGDKIEIREQVKLVPDTMKDAKGDIWLPLFTDTDEVNKGKTSHIRVNFPVEAILKAGLERKDIQGVVINPFGRSFPMTKSFLKVCLDGYEKLKADRERKQKG